MSEEFYNPINDGSLDWQKDDTEYLEVECPDCKTEVARIEYYSLFNVHGDYVSSVMLEACPNPACGRRAYWNDVEFDHIRRPQPVVKYKRVEVL